VRAYTTVAVNANEICSRRGVPPLFVVVRMTIVVVHVSYILRAVEKKFVYLS